MKEKILERLYWFKNRIDELGGYAEFSIKEPATEEQVIEIEKQLGYTIPEDFRKTLLEFSSHLYFYWNIYKKEKEIVELPDALIQIFSGSLEFGLNSIIECEESRKGWIDCYKDYDEPYDQIFQNKLAFQDVGNGDLLAIDLNKATYGNVVYLSHDGSDLHGYVLANSFLEFLEEYSKLGCVGAEDWQWEVFTNDNTTPIDSKCENAKLWLKTIGKI